MRSGRGGKAPRKLVIAALGAALLAWGAGCVEAQVHERTTSQLDAMTRAATLKDQQMRVLEWQVATLAHQLREAQARSDAAMREIALRLDQASQARAACDETLRREEALRGELSATLAAAEAAGRGGSRGRPDDLKRLVAALDAQNARLLERIGRLEQKIDARTVEERNAARLRPSRPERTVDAEIVDPWGFGARK